MGPGSPRGELSGSRYGVKRTAKAFAGEKAFAGKKESEEEDAPASPREDPIFLERALLVRGHRPHGLDPGGDGPAPPGRHHRPAPQGGTAAGRRSPGADREGEPPR